MGVGDIFIFFWCKKYWGKNGFCTKNNVGCTMKANSHGLPTVVYDCSIVL